RLSVATRVGPNWVRFVILPTATLPTPAPAPPRRPDRTRSVGAGPLGPAGELPIFSKLPDRSVGSAPHPVRGRPPRSGERPGTAGNPIASVRSAIIGDEGR